MEIIIETPELDKIHPSKWFNPIEYLPLQKKEINTLLEKEVWVTARRVKYRVQDMKTSHINNCINCFEGKGKSSIPEDYLGGKEKWLKIFRSELLRRQ